LDQNINETSFTADLQNQISSKSGVSTFGVQTSAQTWSPTMHSLYGSNVQES